MTVLINANSNSVFMQAYWPLLQKALSRYVISTSNAISFVEEMICLNDYEVIYQLMLFHIRANEWTTKMIQAMNETIRYTYNTLHALTSNPRVTPEKIVRYSFKFEKMRIFCTRVINELELEQSNSN